VCGVWGSRTGLAPRGDGAVAGGSPAKPVRRATRKRRVCARHLGGHAVVAQCATGTRLNGSVRATEEEGEKQKGQGRGDVTPPGQRNEAGHAGNGKCVFGFEIFVEVVRYQTTGTLF
jgi:hypothetical protein